MHFHIVNRPYISHLHAHTAIVLALKLGPKFQRARNCPPRRFEIDLLASHVPLSSCPRCPCPSRRRSSAGSNTRLDVLRREMAVCLQRLRAPSSLPLPLPLSVRTAFPPP